MSRSPDHHKFLEAFACAHVSDEFMENDGDIMVDFFMKMQGSATLAVTEVKRLKDEGNGFFKKNEFDMAAACYDEACKLLSLSLGNIGGEDIKSLSDLAVSLLSNMAACALKLEGYGAASGMCSLILDTFPRNVKALFRRAVASIKLKRFLKAEVDLVEALAVEPYNKDVLRELEVVRGHLLIKENGKRVLEVHTEDCVEGNNKKHIHVSASDVGIKDGESVITEVTQDQSDVSMKDNESVNMEETEFQSMCAKKSVLEFTKKGCGSSHLRIPVQSYKNLLDGKKMSFYRKRDLTTLTIRILKSEDTKESDILKERCKKKKRRRHKKRKSKMMGAMNEDTTSVNNMDVNPATPSGSLSASGTEAMTSSESPTGDSFGDNFRTGDMFSSLSSTCDTPPNRHIYQDNSKGFADDTSLVCRVNEKATSIYPPAHNGFKDHEPFTFSARPKKCKIFSLEKPSYAKFTPIVCRCPSSHHARMKWRNATSKKNQSHGDESPRHILSTSTKSRSLSYKLLRPRGVSVSCRRYSSEAQLIKKRKEMFAQVQTPDRPAKKPCLVVNPFCSLCSNPSNVVISSCNVVISSSESAGTA